MNKVNYLNFRTLIDQLYRTVEESFPSIIYYEIPEDIRITYVTLNYQLLRQSFDYHEEPWTEIN